MKLFKIKEDFRGRHIDFIGKARFFLNSFGYSEKNSRSSMKPRCCPQIFNLTLNNFND